MTSDDGGQGIKVRVNFSDDAGHEESLTGYAVAVLASPLTAEFPQSPFQSLSHKGANDRPQVIVAFSRAVRSIAETTPSVLVTGATVSSVRAHEEDGLEHAWVFFLVPTGTDAIRFSLLVGQSCEAGGICAADGTTLSVSPAARIIPGPEEEEDESEPQQQQQEGEPDNQGLREPLPLTADFPQSPYQSLSHKGANDRPQVIVAFSRAVSSFAETTPSVLVTGGTVSSVRAHEEDGLEHAWVFFLVPTGTDDIRFSLLSGQYCEAGGICAADGTTLSVSPATLIIPGPEEKEG